MAEAVRKSFGSFDGFKEPLAQRRQPSFDLGGRACAYKGGELEVCSTANQDNPLMPGVACSGVPILELMFGNTPIILTIKTEELIISMLFSMSLIGELLEKFR